MDVSKYNSFVNVLYVLLNVNSNITLKFGAYRKKTSSVTRVFFDSETRLEGFIYQLKIINNSCWGENENQSVMRVEIRSIAKSLLLEIWSV